MHGSSSDATGCYHGHMCVIEFQKDAVVYTVTLPPLTCVCNCTLWCNSTYHLVYCDVGKYQWAPNNVVRLTSTPVQTLLCILPYIVIPPPSPSLPPSSLPPSSLPPSLLPSIPPLQQLLCPLYRALLWLVGAEQLVPLITTWAAQCQMIRVMTMIFLSHMMVSSCPFVTLGFNTTTS